MRGVAALGIVIYHVPSLAAVLPVSSAYLAVDLFFVLSGFVIAHAYGEKLKGQWSALQFMKVRLIRLWPLYVLGILIAAATTLAPVMSGHAPVMSWGGYAKATVTGILFLPTWPDHAWLPLYPLNIPAWSLLIELVANLVAALVWRRLSDRWLGAIIAVGAISVIFTSSLGTGLGDEGWRWSTVGGGLARVLFAFPAGIALYRAKDRFARLGLHPLALALGIALCFTVNVGGPLRVLYDLAAVLLYCPALVASGSASRPWKGAAPAFLMAGQLSYGIYVLHVPLWSLAAAACGLFGRRGWSDQAWFAFLFVIGVLVFAWIAGKLYDAPLRGWLNGRRKPIPAIA